MFHVCRDVNHVSETMVTANRGTMDSHQVTSKPSIVRYNPTVNLTANTAIAHVSRR